MIRYPHRFMALSSLPLTRSSCRTQWSTKANSDAFPVSNIRLPNHLLFGEWFNIQYPSHHSDAQSMREVPGIKALMILSFFCPPTHTKSVFLFGIHLQICWAPLANVSSIWYTLVEHQLAIWILDSQWLPLTPKNVHHPIRLSIIFISSNGCRDVEPTMLLPTPIPTNSLRKHDSSFYSHHIKLSSYVLLKMWSP